MSEAQWRVFGIEIAILAIELTFSSLLRDYVKGVGGALTAPSPATFGQLLSAGGKIDMSLVALWVLSAVILLGIADVAPVVGTWIAFLILVGVVLANGDKIASWLNATVTYMTDLRTKSESYPGVRPKPKTGA